MTDAKVNLEEVTRAARQALMLAVTVTLLALGAMVALGLPLVVAMLVAAMQLAAGAASGGFGLVARVALPRSRPRRSPAASGQAVSLRVPQTR